MSQDAQFTPDQLAYMMAHKDDTLVPNTIACVVICGAVTTAFVVLRLTARTMIKGHLRLDLSDWLMVLALIFFQVYNLFFGLSTRYGAGRHMIFITDMRMLQICSVIGEVIYNWAMGFIKLSILAFYGSIFPLRRFRYALWAVAIFTGAWILTATFAGIFQCVPVEYGWDRTIEGGYCIKYGRVVLVVSVTNIVTDFIILLMPINPVRGLQMSPQKKKLVLLTFALGSSACIVSIVRLPYALRVATNDGSYDVVTTGFLCNAELTVGLFVASLPTYRPLLRRVIHGTETKKTTSTYAFMNYANGHSKANSRGVRISANRSALAVPAPGQGINVTNDIQLSSRSASNNASSRHSDEVILIQEPERVM